MKGWLVAAALLAAGLTVKSPASAGEHALSSGHSSDGPMALAVPVVVDPGSAPQRKVKSTPRRVFAERWRHAMDMPADDAKAPSVLAWILAHPDFARLTLENRIATLTHAAFASMLADDLDTSHRLIVQAIDLGSAHPRAWHLRLALEASRAQPEAAAESLLHIIRHFPHLLDDLDRGLIVRTALGTPAESAAGNELIATLLSTDWNNHGLGMAAFRYRLALVHLTKGDKEAVRTILPTLADDPDSVLRVRSDLRFDGLYAPEDDSFVVESAARRNLARLQALAAEQADSLEVRVQLSYGLLTLGLHDEVIALANQVEAAMAENKTSASPYKDPHEANWIINNRAVALRYLGRLDEAQAELARSAAMDEHGNANVSQVLNLGRFLCHRGRPGEARAAIEMAGFMSGYGRLVQMSVQHCAAIQQDDRAGADQAIAYLRENRSETPEPWIDALVLENRLDEAAQALADALADSQSRSDMLLEIQQYRQVPPLPGTATRRQNWQRLLARDDVRATIARYGRIERHGIFGRIEY